MTVRIGIIGSRFVANLHALAVRQAPGAELVAAASPNTEHAWAFHRRYEIPHVFQDYKDMLDSGFVDAVTVACPNDLHCEVTLAAAAAGKHVFVDKPLALSLQECDRMIEACGKSGVVLMYGENLCFAPKYVRAKESADEGALGEVYYVRQLECHYGPHSEWFWDVTRSGGGVLMDMGCHSIAFCRWAFGNAPIERVFAEIGTFVHGDRTRGDDHSLVVMRFAPSEKHPRGGVGVAENSWGRAGGLDDRAEIYGSAGMTMADIARGSALNTYSGPGYQYAGEKAPRSRGWSWTSFEEAWNYGFPQEMAQFVESIEQGKPPTLTGEDGRAVLEVVCAAYESARMGARVGLPFANEAKRPIDLWLANRP
jgi:predicted dehydrogenase